MIAMDPVCMIQVDVTFVTFTLEYKRKEEKPVSHNHEYLPQPSRSTA